MHLSSWGYLVIGIIKEYTIPGKAVKMRRFYHRVAVAACNTGKVVNSDEKYIGLSGRIP